MFHKAYKMTEFLLKKPKKNPSTARGCSAINEYWSLEPQRDLGFHRLGDRQADIGGCLSHIYSGQYWRIAGSGQKALLAPGRSHV